MPMNTLLKSYFVTSILASPRIIKICLPLMNKVANSESALLNPDRNPILRMLIRKLIYDHFVAGETPSQVKESVRNMKSLGLKGVILGYAKEVNVSGGLTRHEISTSDGDVGEASIGIWKEGLLETLSLLGPGDFLSLKFSGAGPSALEALANQKPPPTQVQEAMVEICETAATRGARVWVDAEQQDIQPTIEQWTTNLMRMFNKGEKALLYTTMQAYLKQTPQNILKHLQLAQREEWILGIKLVRGAYIATERRTLIHDTIQDTHNAYNTIANNLLRQSYPGITTSENLPYPRAELFLATHNDQSIKLAYSTQSSLIKSGGPTIELAYGQLQGMADEISCGLLQLCAESKPQPKESLAKEKIVKELDLAPKAYKCMIWGSAQESLQFLLRRVKENKDALGRTEYWVKGFRKEIWRRVRLGLRVGSA
ncbi:proline dehydrogenase [Clarireedia jacksonii]